MANNNPTVPLAREVPKEQNNIDNQPNQNQQQSGGMQPAGQQNQQQTGQTQTPQKEPVIPAGYGNTNQTQTNFDQQLTGAPPTMTQNQPSNFSPNTNQPKRRLFRRRTCIGCCCSILLLIIFAIVGLGAYSYFADVDIPVITDVVEKIEQQFFADPVEEAKVYNKQMSASLVGMLAPMLKGNPQAQSLFEEGVLDEQYLNSLFEGYTDVESYRYDLSAYAADEEDEVDLAMRGSLNMKDSKNPKSDMQLNIDAPVEGLNIAVDLSIKAVDQNGYIKIDKYPSVVDDYVNLSEIEDKWINMSDLIDMGERYSSLLTSLVPVATEVEENQDKISKEEMEKAIEFLSDETVVGGAEFIEDEVIEGNDCKCIQIKWNGEEFEEMAKKYYEIFEIDTEDADLDDISEDVESMTLETCSGKDTGMIHKVKFYGSGYDGEDDKEATIDFEIDLKLWDYNSDIEVEVPTDTISTEEALDTVLDTETKDQIISMQMYALNASLEMYNEENGSYPKSLDETSVGSDLLFVDKASYKLSKDGSSYTISVTLLSGEKLEMKSGEVTF